MTNGSPYTDGWYWSLDGLRLHFRDYPAVGAVAAARPAILCLPGLTRNARDFDGLASRLGGEWRVIAADLRGRGESAYAKDPLTYVPLTYLQDVGALLAAAQVERFVVVGTSLGGLLAMLLPVTHRAQIAGAILNDIGPVIEANGLARIRGLVGRGGGWPTWMHAARDLAGRNAEIYPHWETHDWLAFAKALCRINNAGRIVPDYDARIAEPFRLPGGDSGVDMWAAFDGLAGAPVLSVRGELSDILSAATQAAMRARRPNLQSVVVPGVGHAPTLDEPEAVAAMDGLLAGLTV